MHPYLTRLGVRPEVQEFFAPFYSGDAQGNLVFDYRDAAEHFGFAFHRIPVSDNCWQAGNLDFNIVSKVFICSSAMEAIAFYHYKYAVYPHRDRLLFLSVGTRPNASQVWWITEKLAGKDFTLVFGNSLLDKVGELATAAALLKMPLDISVAGNQVTIHFRLKEYVMPIAVFSLSAFEKRSGYRFPIRSARVKHADSYFSLLKSFAFNQ